MIHSPQWHLEEAERITEMLAVLTAELDLTQPAHVEKIHAYEHQAELHLKLAGLG